MLNYWKLVYVALVRLDLTSSMLLIISVIVSSSQQESLKLKSLHSICSWDYSGYERYLGLVRFI